MTSKPHLHRFIALRSEAIGDPHSLETDLLRVLWVMSVLKNDDDLEYSSPSQIADILCDVEEINISRQRVAAILDKERTLVSRRKIGGKFAYRVMRAGLDALPVAAISSVYVDPDAAFTQIRRFEDVLARMKGQIDICDPYIENRTLDLLAECKLAVGIRLLTTNVLKESTLRRDLVAFRREHLSDIEIRVQTGLHDRYIVHDGGMLLLGTSLNGFAKKQSFMVAAGPDIRNATVTAFTKLWATATKFQ